MSFADARLSFESTSAAGAMRQLGGPVLVGVMLADLGTSTERLLPVALPVTSSVRSVQQTTSGVPVVLVERAEAAIAELRRISGLKWEQLARLFDVSRRSLHFWASGKVMTPANEEHLQRLLGVLRKIDRGCASVNRAALLDVGADGVIPFDLLAERNYDSVVAIIGHRQGPERVVSPPLLEAAKLARAPRSPADLVGAQHGSVHRETGVSRPAKSVRTRGDG